MNVRIAIDHSSAQLQWVVYKWYGCFSFVRNLWLHARLFEGSCVPVVARKCRKRSFFASFFVRATRASGRKTLAKKSSASRPHVALAP